MSHGKRIATSAALLAFSALPAFSEPADVVYRHDLADFTGTIPTSDARVVVDPPRSEVYTVYGNEVRVFNDAGMEIYRFSIDLETGRLVDLAVEESGDLLLLVYESGAGEGNKNWSLLRADFRGRPSGALELERRGETEAFLPNRLLLRNGKIWLVSQGQMRAGVWDRDGSFERALDLAALGGLPEEERASAEVSGFDVAADGTVVFAIPVQFRVHAIDPDGNVRSFGKAGSAAGNFGVLGDVALDGEGNLFVSDRLRSLVMVFRPDFRFLREFGRTANRESLARPGAMAVDPSGRLYVSQVRNRGVAVFAIASAL
jgi:hypothetical protein